MGDTPARLLASATPFIDLRSPSEFARGSVPGAVNLPLLNDQERDEVGTTYRHNGREAAISLGHQLVQGLVKHQRVSQWQQFARTHENAQLFCWRGGLRSQIAQRWLAETGFDLPRVEGGFKQLRAHCLEVLSHHPRDRRLLVLGGRTGSGKTQIIRQFKAHVDLEGLANHRGSAFGAQDTPQPPPISFENALAVAFMTIENPVVLLEDESRTVGRLGIPTDVYQAMQQAPLIMVEVAMAERVAHIKSEYVTQPLDSGTNADALKCRFLNSLARINKRLGGERGQQLQAAVVDGFNTDQHEHWIEALLTQYYDPMYDFQLRRKASRIVFRGSAKDVMAYLTQALSGHGHEVVPQNP